MKIRFLTQDDVAEHNKVSSQAFVYACEVDDPNSALPCPKVLGAFDDDGKTLLADFELQERVCHYDGGLLTCAAIGGVAAKPEHRGKGAVTALFHHLFRERPYDISILYPFSEPYYRRLGYERVGCSVSVTVPLELFVILHLWPLWPAQLAWTPFAPSFFVLPLTDRTRPEFTLAKR